MGLQKLRLLKGTDCDVRTETTPHALNGRVWKNGSRSRLHPGLLVASDGHILADNEGDCGHNNCVGTGDCSMRRSHGRRASGSGDAYHRVVGLIAGAGTRILSPT